MLQKIGGFTWTIIAGVLIVILGFINIGQRTTQPRYQLPGRTYQVTIQQPKVTQPSAQPGRPGQPATQVTSYYVFDKNRDQGRVVVTTDRQTAKQAQTKTEKFNQLYKAQKDSGMLINYGAEHHKFIVAQRGVNSVDAAQRVVLLQGKDAKVKHGKVHAQFNNNDSDVNATMTQVKFKK